MVSIAIEPTVALAWSALIAFVRLVANPRVFQGPWDVERALDVIDGWLAQPAVTVIHPTDRHAAVLRDLLGRWAPPAI